VPVAVATLECAALFVGGHFGLARALPERVAVALYSVPRALYPFSITSPYGLFAVMTRPRYEIQVEASEDGARWVPLEFRWKPDDPLAAPRWTAPHMPRLDWMMWFAALGDYRQTPWFRRFLGLWAVGSPPVRALLASDPLDGRPARYMRASLWEWHFTSWGDGEEGWWTRVPAGEFCPEMDFGDLIQPRDARGRR
jgi:hypothetical protein